MLDNFLASIRHGAPASSTLRNGVRAVAVGQVAEMAWPAPRSIEISELLDAQEPLIQAL